MDGRGEEEIRHETVQRSRSSVPVRGQGSLENSRLAKVRAVCCDDGEGVWEREEIALDEATGSENLGGWE